MEAAVIAYTRGVIRFRWLMLVASVLVAVALSSGLAFLQFNDDFAVFFDEDNPAVQEFIDIQQMYTGHVGIFFVVTAESGNVFDQEPLEAIQYIVDRAKTYPATFRVDAITTFPHGEWVDGEFQVAPLAPDPAALTDAERARAREIALNEPMLVNRLVNADGSVTGVNVVVDRSIELKRDGPHIVDEARELIEEVEEQFSGVDVGLTGGVAINRSFKEATEEDLQSLVPTTTLVLMAAMVLLYRSLTLMLATMGVIALSTASALGLAVYLGFEISGPVVPAPVMIMTLAVADSVHILSSLIWSMRHGKNREDALVESMRLNLNPVFLTSLTTCVGFLSMNIGTVPPIATLGNVTAIGVALAFFFSVTFLPALAAFLPLRRREPKANPRVPELMPLMAEFVIRRRRWICTVALAIGITLGAFIPQIRVNNQFVSFFGEDRPIRRDTDYAMEHLTGIYTMTFSVPSGEDGGVFAPAYLNHLDDFVTFMGAQPHVMHVSSIVDTMKRLNRIVNRGADGSYRLPETRGEAELYLSLYAARLPEGMTVRETVNDDRSATKIVVTMENIRSAQVDALRIAAEQWMQTHWPESMQTRALGPWVMFADISKNLMRSMYFSVPLVLFLVSCALLVALRSVRMGLLSLIPNLMPIAMGFGLWSLLGWDMDFSMVGISAMAIGIVVDDTVHFMSKYLRARRERGESAEDAVRYAFNSVGRALFITSFVLICGFMVPTTSTFLYSQNLGLLTSMIIAFALAGALLFMPALLLILDQATYNTSGNTQESNQDKETSDDANAMASA